MPIHLREAGLHIVPIKSDFLRRTRQQGLDDLGQPVERHIAEGGEPCRDALRRAKPGEAILLASYSPFALVGPYREFGPIFVLAEAEPEPPVLDALPAANDGAYFGQTFVLRAYSAKERIVDAVLSTPEQALTDLQRLFARNDVAFVLARFAAYGCYGCRIERN